jgi:ribosome-binding factor A
MSELSSKGPAGGSHRRERLAEAMREELSEILAGEVADPSLQDFTVTSVEPAPDLRSVRILVAFSEPLREGDQRPMRGLRRLERASGFLRRELSQRLDLRRAPDLHFELDRGRQSAQRVEVLLERLKKRPNSGLS